MFALPFDSREHHENLYIRSNVPFWDASLFENNLRTIGSLVNGNGYCREVAALPTVRSPFLNYFLIRNLRENGIS